VHLLQHNGIEDILNQSDWRHDDLFLRHWHNQRN